MSEEDSQATKKVKRTVGGLAKKMKPASPPKARRGGVDKYIEVESSGSGSEEGGSMFVDE